MVNVTACTIELQMHLGGLLSTQEARVARGDTHLSCLATSRVHLKLNSARCDVYHLLNFNLATTPDKSVGGAVA